MPDEDPSSMGVFEYSLRFPGQQYDTVVGLHYNYFRDYDPAVGRYVESDPIGLGDGPNTYSYAASNPVHFFDPTGEFVPGAVYAAEAAYSAYRAWTAAGAMVGIAAGASAAHEYEKQKSYLEINRNCLKQPKNPGDYCAWLGAQIAHFENCAKWYQWWDNKYSIGRHKEKIDGWRNRAENLKKLYDKLCTQKCSPMTGDSK
jgi:RHS repeat-associated protein